MDVSLNGGSIAILRVLRGIKLDPEEKDVDFDYVKDVLRYFLRHPQASDDLEGITRWRLLDQRIEDSLIQVNRAVRWLVSEGVLMQDPARTSHPVFRLNKDRSNEIAQLVRDLADGNLRHK